MLGGCCPAESRFLRPLRLTEPTPERAEDVWIDAPGGGRLHAWFVRPAGATGAEPLPAILFLHGRADFIGTYRDLAPWFADEVGASMLLVDYRGWGRSSDVGCPSRRSMIADGNAAYAYLLTRADVDPTRLAIWGASLGGYPATAVMADNQEPVALALWASPADVRWLLDDYRDRITGFRGVMARAMIGPYREPRDQVRRLGGRPLLIVHGQTDEIVPMRHGAEIAERARAAGVDVEYFPDPESSHMSVSEAALRRIAAFLGERLIGATGGGADGDDPPPAGMFPPRTDSPPAEPGGG